MTSAAVSGLAAVVQTPPQRARTQDEGRELPLAKQSARRYWRDHFGRCTCQSRGHRGHGVAFGLRELVPEPGHHPGRVRGLRIDEQALHDL
jgi:hypothetical protein